MAQRNIDFGSFPDDPSADAIRTAFQKVQENFTEVFAGLADQAVSSINKTPGAGISVNSPTGNVIVTANIACVQVETSTLGIGIGTGNNVATYASLTSSAQILTIDLPSNIANVTDITIDGTLTANYVNANIALTSSNNLFVTSNANVGNLNANNATITANFSAGNLSTAGNLVVSTNANITGTLGVQGNANVGNLGTSGTIDATGNIIGGNLNANLQITATGNITGQNILSNANVVANGNVVAGNMYANTGTVGAANLTGTLTTNAQPNITSVGTLISLDVTGNITGGNANLGNAVVANYFIGSGANLTNINGANVTGTAGNANFAAYAGNVTVSAQSNITSVGTLTSLDVTGNITGGNANLGNLVIANYITGTLTTNAQPNVTSVGTLTSLDVTGNILSGNVYANAGTVGAANLTGTLTTNAQPNVTSVGTLTSLNVSGNITAPNVTANTGIFTGNGAGLTNLAGANVTGTVANATYALSAGTANTVTVAAQPNITSVGTLTGLSIGGDILPNANITYDLGNNTNRFKDIYLANSTIYLGAATLQANSSALILTNPQGGQLIVTGSNTANGASIVNGNSNVVVDANSNVTISVAGTSNVLTVTSTGANIIGTANVSGNLSAGNASLGNAVTANYFIGSGANLTNIAGANVTGTVANASNATVANTVDILNTNGLTTTFYPTFVENRTTGQTVRADVDLTYRSDINTLTTGNLTATGTVTGATLAGSLSTASQPNVTSLGTLTGLGVNGTITATNVTANTGVFTGNGAGLTNIAGANVTGTVANATYAVSAGSANTAGTVTTASQPNITSVGTLTGLDVSGNASFTGANIYISNIANFRIPGGTSGYTIKTDGAGNLAWGADTAAAAGSNTDVQFNDAGSIGGTSGLTFNKTSNLLTVSGGLTVSNASATVNFTNTANVTLGSVANLHISGGGSNTVLTTNGSGGLSFTAFAGTPPGGPNGAVQYNSSTVYTGEAAFAYNDSTNTLTVDNITLVGSGNLTGGNLVSANFVTGTLTTASQPNITSIGTLSNLIVSGNINSGNITGNGFGLTSSNGANVSGQVANALVAGTVYTAAQPNITSVGTLTSLSVTGSVTAGNANLGNSVVANFFTGNLYGTANTATLAAHVTDNSQPNITSVGSLTSLIVNGNINAGNIAGGNLVSANFFSGNANALFNIQGANVTGTVANATYATSAGSATTAGTVTTAAQPNITSVGTLSSLSVTGTTTSGNFATAGNITASFLVSNVSTGTAPLTVTSTTRVSNLNVSYANVSDFNGVTSVNTGTYYLMMGNVVTGNVALSGNTAFSANAANGSITATTFVGALSGAATSATTAGTVTTAAQPNITSVGTLTSLGVSGTITAANVTANTGVFTGNANGLTSIPGANVTGTVPSATSATSATTAGTVTTAAQPNITSVGTLTSLTSSGNISGANIIATAYHIRSVGTGISAAGSTQGTATAITKEMNVVSTVSSGQGVVLPTAVAGMVITITNTSANSLLVYPASGGAINSLAANAGYTQQSGGTIQFIAPTTTQWYTVGATYA